MIKVACIQMEPKVGQKRANIAHARSLVEEAGANGAQLVVLPELCNSGYVFESMAEAKSLAEPFPGGETCDVFQEVAARLDLYLVAGVAELDGDNIYNSSVLIGPAGYIGTFRKVHLWNEENLFFTPGDKGFPVFDTALGRIGTVICYDCWFPESYRECALKQADIICVPTNWVPINGQKPDREAMANILTMSAAHSNSVFVACANRIGTERGQPFIGQSLIVSFTGWPVAGPASPDREEIIYADLDLSDPARGDAWNKYNKNPLGDRRPEEYRAVGDEYA